MLSRKVCLVVISLSSSVPRSLPPTRTQRGKACRNVLLITPENKFFPAVWRSNNNNSICTHFQLFVDSLTLCVLIRRYAIQSHVDRRVDGGKRTRRLMKFTIADKNVWLLSLFSRFLVLYINRTWMFIPPTRSFHIRSLLAPLFMFVAHTHKLFSCPFQTNSTNTSDNHNSR